VGARQKTHNFERDSDDAVWSVTCIDETGGKLRAWTDVFVCLEDCHLSFGHRILVGLQA